MVRWYQHARKKPVSCTPLAVVSGANGTSIVVLHVTVVPLGSVVALCAALGVCVLWNVGLTVRQRLRRPRAIGVS